MEKNYKAMSNDELLAAFDSSDVYDLDLCAEICSRAGMAAEWAAADGDGFEDVVNAAIEKLN